MRMILCRCGATFEVTPSLAGRQISCRKCGRRVSIPAASSPGKPFRGYWKILMIPFAAAGLVGFAIGWSAVAPEIKSSESAPTSKKDESRSELKPNAPARSIEPESLPPAGVPVESLRRQIRDGAITDEIDGVLAGSEALTEEEREALYRILARTPYKAQLAALFGGEHTMTGWASGRHGRAWLAELHADHAPAITAKERLELGRTVPVRFKALHPQTMELMARWADSVTDDQHVALIEEAVESYSSFSFPYGDARVGGREVFFRSFVRHRFEEMGVPGFQRLIARCNGKGLGGMLARLLLGPMPPVKPEPAYTRPTRRTLALMLRSAPGSETAAEWVDAWLTPPRVDREEVAPVALEMLVTEDVSPVLLKFVRDRVKPEQLDAIVASKPSAVIANIDYVTLATRDRGVRWVIFDALIASFEGSDPRPPQYARRDALLKKHARECDPLPRILRAYLDNRAIRKKPENREYVLEVLISFSDARLIGFLAAEHRRTFDPVLKGRIEAALLALTRAKEKPADWEKWLEANKSLFPDQLRGS